MYNYFYFRRCILVIFILFELWISSHKAEESDERPRTSNPRWERWTSWSECSSECGAGISERSRRCRSMLDGSVTDGCEGEGHQIKVCTIKGCITADEASEACKELDDVNFRGRRYRWEPYPHPVTKCEIACRPIGHGFYQALGRNFTNGTSCSDDSTNVCVNGECKEVGCDSIVNSNTAIDKCGVCGGDGTSCTTITKTFTDSVKFGYHTIGTIPAGARKIIVSEMQESRNYLALKAADGSFRLNMDWRLSRFGDQPGAGTVFTYAKNSGPDCPGECITAEGPTDMSINVVGLFYTSSSGIKYTYSISSDNANIVIKDAEPDNNDENRDGPIFSYDFTFKKKKGHRHRGHHKRNRANGKQRHNRNRDELKESKNYGSRTAPDSTITDNNEIKLKVDNENDAGKRPIISKESTVTVIDETNQNPEKHKPVIVEDDLGGGVYLNEDGEESDEPVRETEEQEEQRRSNTKDNQIPSLYSWRLAGYADCSSSCGEGKRSTIVECIVTDKRTAVDDIYCAELTKPNTRVVTCNYGPCPTSWQPRPWSKCSLTCGSGIQRREYVCTRTDGAELRRTECATSRQPRSEERTCNAGSCNEGWYYTEWPETCPVSCGSGSMTRKVYCSSGTGNVEAVCPKSHKPQTEKACRGDDCGGNWFTGPWSQCNATCGMAYQTRTVVCVLKQRHGRITVVGDNYCTGEEKPSTYMSCDLEACQPEWYMNEWGRCTASCGSGQRSRDVKCLDSNKRPSSGCTISTKPPVREPCKRRDCPSLDEAKPNPPESDCKDSFSSCSLVLQTKLCQYKYYNKICCKSCSGRKN